MGLLADFKAAAVARGRFPDDERLTPAALFSLVRDMPYAPPSAPAIEAVLGEWRGTSFEKHYLLDALYEEFGLPSLLMCALHEVTVESAPWLPSELRSYLEPGPLPDVHHFLRLELQGEWMTIDATWPLAAASLGLPVNARFEPGRQMAIACDPDEVFHVPPGLDAPEYVAQVVERHVGADAERRNRFIETLAAWVATASAPAAASTPPSS